MRAWPFLLALLVLPLASAYGILIVGKDLNVVDANAYADYVIGRTALCIGSDCRTAWPAGIATLLGVPPIVVSGTGDTRTVELNYDSTRGLAVENNQLYVPIGTGLTYSSGAIALANPAISCPSGALSGFDLGTGASTCIPVDENGLDDVTDLDLNVFNGYIWHIRRDTIWYPLGASDVNCVDCVALGQETTGQYVESVQAGPGIGISTAGTEGLSVTVTNLGVRSLNDLNGDVNISAGSGITITESGSTITVAHADTSSATTVSNTGGVVIQSIGLDTFGHVTDINSVDLDTRYVPLSRRVDTLAPLTGGGALSSDLTLGLNVGTGLTVNAGALEMNVTSDISCPAGEVLTLVNPATGAYTCTPVDTNPGDDVTGTGDTNYLPYWTGSQTLGTTNIYYDATNGRVGIGTNTPVAPLDVLGEAVVRTSAGFVDTDGGAEFHVGAQEAPAGTAGEAYRVAIQPYGHTGGPWNIVARDTSNAAYLDLRYGLGPTLLTIHWQGKVGIGTLDPTEKLDVNGNVKASQLIDWENSAYYLDPASTSELNNVVANKASMSYVDGAGQYSLSVGGGILLKSFYVGDNNDAYVTVMTPSGGVRFRNNVDAVLYGRIGNPTYFLYNVGIGTTTPSEKLDVNGNVKASKFVDRDNTAYYVDPASTTTAAKLAGPLDMNGNSITNVAGAGYNALGCVERTGSPPACVAGESPTALWTDGTTWHVLCCKR